MIRLNPKDASVLARIAQYLELPPGQRRQMLDETTTPEAREIGAILLGELDPERPDISADVKETVEALRSWSNKSRQATAARSAAFGSSSRQSRRA
jgi:hypothetical protein